MSDRIWFHASEGQQKGPFPEAQFRDLIAKGIVRPDTLVWSEGMTGWQKAGAVPGLVPGASPVAASSDDARGQLSVDLPLWSFLGWCILLVVGNLVVVPAPWIATGYYRWLFPRVHVPQRPNIGFTGQVGDIWYVFIALAILGYAGLYGDLFQLAAIPLQAFLSWMILRWVVANISSNGQPIAMTFNGSPWAFIGWQFLMFLAMFTIIGWAWVMAAWMRWICRHVAGTRREIIFVGTGLQLLWRTLAFGLGCLLIIPIPWVLRWYFTWSMTQFALVDRARAPA